MHTTNSYVGQARSIAQCKTDFRDFDFFKWLLFDIQQKFPTILYRTKYSRMDQVRFVEDINFIWSILEYFVPYIRNSNPNIIPNNKCVTNLYRSEAKSKNSVIITFTYTSLKNYESYSRVPNNRPLPPIVNFFIFSTQGIFIPIPSPSSRPYY